jgi:hypothetical protein
MSSESGEAQDFHPALKGGDTYRGIDGLRMAVRSIGKFTSWRRRAMRKTVEMNHRCWMIVITVVSLSLVWSLAGLTLARADNADALCTLMITANGNVLGTLANKPLGFNLVVLIPATEDVNVPVLCSSLTTLALAIANQTDQSVTVNLGIFNHEGQSSCTKGPFSLPVNGARGVTF